MCTDVPPRLAGAVFLLGVQCLQRWNKVLKPGLKKGSWTVEEDAKLFEAVKKQLEQGNVADAKKDKEKFLNWAKASVEIPGRTPKQCRERWRCNLDPSISKVGHHCAFSALRVFCTGKNSTDWFRLLFATGGLASGRGQPYFDAAKPDGKQLGSFY